MMNLGAPSGTPPYMPQLKPKKKGMRRYIIGLVVAVIVVAVVIVLISMSFGSWLGSLLKFTPSVPPSKPIHHIDYFIVQKEGESLQPQFALMTEGLEFTTADGVVNLNIRDSSTNRSLYETTFSIKTSDFKYYETLFGKTVLAYQWSISLSGVQKCMSSAGASITFTTTDSRSFSDTTDYVSVPTYTEDEIKQIYENMYVQSATTVNQTVSKEPFSITLLKVGNFSHLKYDTWGDEVLEFRVDLRVTNIAGQSEYLFGSSVVIIDDLHNQYNYEYGGTLTLGEIHAGVVMEGYLEFPALNANARTITVKVTKTAYPQDITYEFTVNL